MDGEFTDSYEYLDYAATAPLSEAAAEALAPFMVEGVASLFANANANSLHSPGRHAFELLERARRALAQDLGAKRPDEIIFTGSATEADNAALEGIVQGLKESWRKQGKSSQIPHIITSAIEHDAVLAPVRRLEAQGCRVTRLKPDRQGFIEVRALEEALDDFAALISIQMANSEIGAIQAIKELAAVTHDRGALFHTDAVQALGKIPVDLQDLGVDAATFSAHKIGGPKGIGALYLKARTPFAPFILGGGQEAGRRSGTQNVAGACGFAAACDEAVDSVEEEGERLRELRDQLYRRLGELGPVEATVEVDPGSRDYLPSLVHCLVDGFESETLVLRLDSLGYGVSGGSACASHSLEPSHVLKALDIPQDKAQGALRVSMGRLTTRATIDGFMDALKTTLDWR